jgi:hypothetical protein
VAGSRQRLAKGASIAQGWLADHEAPKETTRGLMLMLDQPLPPKRAPIAYVADGSQRSISQERMALSAASELQGLLALLCAMVTRRPRLLVAALVAGWNGLIALVVLLIAPLGLAAVLTLTLLITLNSFAGFWAGSRVIGWLEPGGRPSGAERSLERQRLRGTRG